MPRLADLPEVPLSETYDVPPAYQSRLRKWLKKTKATVDLGVVRKTPRGAILFRLTTSGGTEIQDEDLESVLNTLMDSKATQRLIVPDFAERVREFLHENDAHITFMADGDAFRVRVGDASAHGEYVDEDFEVALVLAEQGFGESEAQRSPVTPPRGAAAPRFGPEQVERLREALVPAEQRREELEQQIAEADVAARKLQWAQMEKLAAMSPNHHLRVGETVEVVSGRHAGHHGAVVATHPPDSYTVRIGTDEFEIAGNLLAPRGRSHHPMRGGLSRGDRPRAFARPNPAYAEIRKDLRSGAGAWRVMAGSDVDPQSFRSHDEASEYARTKYGPSGWSVEWYSSEPEETPIGRQSTLQRYGYTP